MLSTCNKNIYAIFYLEPIHSSVEFSSYIFESTTIIDREYNIKIAVDDDGSKDQRIIILCPN